MSMLRSRQTPKARRTALARAASRREEMREALEADGHPICPECLTRIDRTHPGTPLRDGEWTPRTCPGCAREWRVFVRDEGESRRVVGYEQRNDEPGLRAETEEEAMSTKNASKKAASKQTTGEQTAGDQTKQTITARRGREAKHGKTTGQEQLGATENGKSIDTLLEEAGIHPQPLTVPAPAAPPAANGTPEQPDDSGEMCVFAFRLTRAERDEIHSAAGSAKASRFVKAVALAAARRDATALQAAIQAAGENRKS